MWEDVNDSEEREVDWTDDALGNICEGDFVTIDKGYGSEIHATVIQIGEDMVLVEDQHGQQFPVNILRLSK